MRTKVSSSSPPHNFEAEQGLLGALLLDAKSLDEVLADLRPDFFYAARHRHVLTAMRALHAEGAPVDLITVTDRLQQSGKLDEAGGAAYVTTLTDAAPISAMALHYLGIIIRDWKKREAIRLGEQLVHAAGNGTGPDELVAEIESTLQRIRVSSSTDTPEAFAIAQSWSPEAVEWMWSGRIPMGTITILAGVPGLGKSTMLTELVARLSRGQLDGAFAGTPVTALIATAEDSIASTVVPRLTAAGADLARIHLPTEKLLELPEQFAMLERELERTGARVVVIDPLVAYLSSRVNSWRDQDIRRVLAPAVRLAERTRAAIVGVVHLNKGESSDVFTRVGGSIGISAAARSLLVAAADPEGDKSVILANPKNNLAPRAPALRYRLEKRSIAVGETSIETSGIAWLGEADVAIEDLLRVQSSEEAGERQEAADWLRNLLGDGPRPQKEVFAEANKLGFTDRTVWRAKKAVGAQSSKSPGEKAWRWSLP